MGGCTAKLTKWIRRRASSSDPTTPLWIFTPTDRQRRRNWQRSYFQTVPTIGFALSLGFLLVQGHGQYISGAANIGCHHCRICQQRGCTRGCLHIHMRRLLSFFRSGEKVLLELRQWIRNFSQHAQTNPIFSLQGGGWWGLRRVSGCPAGSLTLQGLHHL